MRNCRPNATSIGEPAGKCAKYCHSLVILAQILFTGEVAKVREVESKRNLERTTGISSCKLFIFTSTTYCIFSSSELPVREHCSGVRYVCACNCGRIQGSREDPFSLRQANHDFFQMLAKQCGCAQLESIQFPIFQPSTHNYRLNKIRIFFHDRRSTDVYLAYLLSYAERRNYFPRQSATIPSVAMDLLRPKETRKLAV